jgi:hypothetical protein
MSKLTGIQCTVHTLNFELCHKLFRAAAYVLAIDVIRSSRLQVKAQLKRPSGLELNKLNAEVWWGIHKKSIVA